MLKFRAEIAIIGANPFVFVPSRLLAIIFRRARKDKGPVPICGTVNTKPYRQTLVKFKGDWRLYINTTMLKNSPERIGEVIALTIDFDSADRTIKPHPKFERALKHNPEARMKFDSLPPSRQLEIVRYISFLKTEE